MATKIFYATWLAFCIATLSTTVDATRKKRKSEKFTVFERISSQGARHSPLFALPVGGDEGMNYPSKMMFFNNDLYESDVTLVEEDPDYIVGYSQGHCVETVATGGLVAECFVTCVFYDGSSLTANGPFIIDAIDGVLPTLLAVTGGTGDYKKYTGEVAVSAGPTGGSSSIQFDFNVCI